MTTLKPLALTIALTFICGLSAVAQKQTSSIEVLTDNEAVEFAATGETRKIHVEVFSPSGELIFETDNADGRSIRWQMVNQKGERVSDGVYLATITVTDSVNKRRKRIEQITVGRESRQDIASDSASPSPTAVGPISGEGASGQLAKFNGANSITNSIVKEANSRIGVNALLPAATLHVNAEQPAPLAANGTHAPPLLQTSGGFGGNTTVGGGKTAGVGASISLVAGNGGNAPAGSKRGNGGNILLQPGSTGAGDGTAGLNGNVLIGPGGVGNVGIGTPTPASKLTVNGMIQTTGAGGIKFPDNSIQTKAGLPAVQHNSTLAGAGTASSPLGVVDSGIGKAQLADGAVTAPKIAAGQVVKSVNNLEDAVTIAQGANITVTAAGNTLTIAAPNALPAVQHDVTLSGAGTPASPLKVADLSIGTGQLANGAVTGAKLAVPLSLSASTSSGTTLTVTNTGDAAVRGTSNAGRGVEGISTDSFGLSGFSTNSIGVIGSGGFIGVSAGTTKADGYAGYFTGRSKFTGNLEIDGNELYGTKTRQMLNLYGTLYGIGIQPATFYFRTAGSFNWYTGGAHSNTADDAGTGGTRLMRLDSAGNLTTLGTVNGASDRNLKSNFSAVNSRLILDRVARMPIQSWNYKNESTAVRHIGPTAQDFQAAFEVGVDDKHISMVDADGVALASIQALYQMMQEKDKEIKQLRAQVSQQQAQLNQVKRTSRRRPTVRK